MYMKKILGLSLVLSSMLVACNNSAKDSTEKADSTNEAKGDSTSAKNGVLGVDESTSKFLVDVADVNMTEVEAGKMAQDKGTAARVKAFADMMVKDHTAATSELQNLA